jgi:hypothetical protein
MKKRGVEGTKNKKPNKKVKRPSGFFHGIYTLKTLYKIVRKIELQG